MQIIVGDIIHVAVPTQETQAWEAARRGHEEMSDQTEVWGRAQRETIWHLVFMHPFRGQVSVWQNTMTNHWDLPHMSRCRSYCGRDLIWPQISVSPDPTPSSSSSPPMICATCAPWSEQRSRVRQVSRPLSRPLRPPGVAPDP